MKRLFTITNNLLLMLVCLSNAVIAALGKV
jgi:hypothetical protein